MNFKNIKNTEKPRERLIALGPESLSDYELLAIMLGSGTKEYNVMDLSIELINRYGLDKLLRMSYSELKKIKGIKEAKATKLMACFELAKRCIKKENIIKSFNNAKDVYSYVKSDYLFINEENIMVIYVDVKCRPIYKKIYSNKNIYKVEIPIKEIVKDAMNNFAYGIFLIHNHPSNEIKPSITDVNSTIKLSNILKSIDLILLDHIIVGKDEYFSFEENNILK